MAEMGLAFIGEGDVEYQGRKMSAAQNDELHETLHQ
jgi:histidine ammonia-lyase